MNQGKIAAAAIHELLEEQITENDLQLATTLFTPATIPSINSFRAARSIDSANSSSLAFGFATRMLARKVSLNKYVS